MDLIVPGAEPIILERYYAGDHGNTKNDLFREGWVFNCLGTLKRVRRATGQDDTFYVQDSAGFGAQYELQGDLFRVPSQTLGHGMTNCATGNISGRFNVRNHHLRVDHYSSRMRQDFCDTPTLFTGSGSFQVFLKRKEKYNLDNYDLWMERKPCGNQIEYTYDKHGRPTQIRSLNKNNAPIASVNLNYTFDKEIAISAEGGGKKTRYRYAKDGNRYYLTHLEREGDWVEKFIYDNGKFRKELPEKRIYECEYYQKGNNTVGDAQVKLSGKDARIGRIKFAKATVGTDSKPVITHRFFYHLNTKEDYYGTTVLNGTTGVINALGHKTDYIFDARQRLNFIVNFEGGAPYSTQQFFWQTEGNLISRTYSDSQGQVQCCRFLQYDDRGNVIQEELHGNLTGANSQPVIVDGNGIPLGGIEKHQKNFIYSNDGFNLLLLETDGRKKTIYTYYDQTDLVRTRYLLNAHDDQVHLRQFFIYDDNACVVAEVTDNGTGLNMND